MKSISVIIPTYNSATHIERCLRSVRELALGHELDIEIIVVDATSKDETVNVANNYANHVVTTAKSTIGKQRNLGAEIAKYETIAFIDSDCEVTESWMKYVSKLDCLGFEILTGPVLLAKSKTIMGESTNDLLSDSILTLNSHTFSGAKTRRTQVNEALSANLLISKEAFKSAGGFPELDFNEDTLFSERFRAQGGKIISDPKLLCFHHKHFDSVGHFAKYFFDYGKNYGRTLRKFHLIRRYALASFLFVPIAMISAIAVLLNIISPILFFAFFAIMFLALLLYSVMRNRKPSSILVPFLFALLILSYVVGFYFGYAKNEKQ